MNNVNMVLAIVLSIASMIALTNGLSTVQVQAHEPVIFQYGEFAQEDELYFTHHGSIYVNTVYEDNSGNFRLVEGLQTEYTIDEALNKWYPSIQEDTHSFVYEIDFSTMGLVFMYNDETLTFQLLGAMDLS